MSTPGWYRDPGGRAGHYRFWDGRTWAPTTTATPAGVAAPGPAAGGGAGGRRPRRGRSVVAALVAVVVVLAVVGALVYRAAHPVVDASSPTAAPASSLPAGGDTSASATPSATPSRSPSTSSTPVETPGPAPTPVPCPVGNPFSRQDYARDGRVHGGSLSFPRQRGWQDPGPQSSAFTWAYDLGETDLQLQQSRYVAYAVGAVAVADGFEDPRGAAELAMRCTAASALYSNVASRTDLVDEETTVDGYRAWTLRSEIRTDDARTSSGGDTVQITVVDLDSPEALAFFWGSAPIGDGRLTERLDEVAGQLHVG